MCILVLAWRDRPGDRLVLLGNRDEFHIRRSAPAGWWDDAPDVLGGRDLEAGGSWLGVTRRGRFAVVTNVREMRLAPPPLPISRGALVQEFLRGDASPEAFAREATRRGARFAGFNLICGDPGSAWYASNRAEPRALAPGVHALSNATLDRPWPKAERLRERFHTARDAGDEALLALLADRTPAADADLPDTGLSLERERLLSAAFVASPDYGTRASYLLAIGDDGGARLLERGFDPAARQVDERRFAFRLEAA
jgi:uncharacterized protein with NRDE domain